MRRSELDMRRDGTQITQEEKTAVEQSREGEGNTRPRVGYNPRGTQNIALQWLTEEKKSQGGNDGHEEEEKVKNRYQAMRRRERVQRIKRRRRREAQTRRRRVAAAWSKAQGDAIKTIKACRGLKAATGSNGYKAMRQLGHAAPHRE